MQEEKVFNRKTIHTSIIVISIVVILIIVGFIMLRYSVQGERNLPFVIEQIDIISTAAIGNVQRNEEGIWYAKLFQKNDIYFYIVKNNEYRGEETIRSVIFENFQIEKYNDKGVAILYRQYDVAIYQYTEEFVINDRLEYTGGIRTNTRELQINNQGGLIGFSLVIKELGEHAFNIGETFETDGTLLARIGVSSEDIELIFSFDIVIELGSGNRFRAGHRIELPAGNILEEGMVHREITGLSSLVFRRD